MSIVEPSWGNFSPRKPSIYPVELEDRVRPETIL